MGKLNIQVNGYGMIPRGYGIAPRKEPFPVTDLYFINLILNTHGLSVKFVNPDTNKLEDLNKNNLKKIWDKYSDYNSDVKKPVIQQTPTTPQIENEVVSPIINDQQTIEQPNDTSMENENLPDTNKLEDLNKNNATTHQDNNKNGKNNKKHY